MVEESSKNQHTTSPLLISEEPDATDAERAIVNAGLYTFNRQHISSWADSIPVTILLRDPLKNIRGGLLAMIRWDWLIVDALWIIEKYRKLGYGRALLERAEMVARTRGCRHVALDTTEFQAKALYEKCGYHVFGELADFPPG
jgi:GNAT superfamily N-acetyltransferase